MIRKLLIFIAAFIAVCIASYAYACYENNKAASWPKTSEIQHAFDKSIAWLDHSYPSIKDNHNSALWWMLKQASDINDNPVLNKRFQQYQTEYIDKTPLNIWTPYFRKYYKPDVPDISLLTGYQPYQKFFVYALSCNRDYANAPVIKAQLKADFCGMHYLHPRCVTHQLMSVRLMQERYCGDDAQLAALADALLKTITKELTWDFRVTDSYVQRVLMLAESGKYDVIKPVWVQRIINAQNQDGGWGDLHPVIPLGDSRFIGWTSALPAIRQDDSNFHASAQGIWLMALLLQHAQERSQ